MLRECHSSRRREKADAYYLLNFCNFGCSWTCQKWWTSRQDSTIRSFAVQYMSARMLRFTYASTRCIAFSSHFYHAPLWCSKHSLAGHNWFRLFVFILLNMTLFFDGCLDWNDKARQYTHLIDLWNGSSFFFFFNTWDKNQEDSHY